MSVPKLDDPIDDDRNPSMVVRLIAAWAVVGIPLAWGVWQVLVKSLVLFR
jgi:hypothetical protein